jgi:hypothetical protein
VFDDGGAHLHSMNVFATPEIIGYAPLTGWTSANPSN